MTKDAEIAALKIILTNMAARVAILSREGGGSPRDTLTEMSDACKRAAERATTGGTDRGTFVNDTITVIDEFFKGITIT